MAETFKELKKAIKAGILNELKYSHQNEPKCPHCGADFNIDDNEAWHLYDQDNGDVKCDSCGNNFQVTVYCKYTFSTNEQPEMDDDDA